MDKSNDSKKSKKFQEIIKTAYELFMRYGIKRITIEEICRTAGVSKMTFYKYFSNKNDLALFVLDDIFTKGEKRYQNIMDQKVPYSEKVKDIIKMKLEVSKDVSQEMLQDLWHNSDPEVADYMTKRTQLVLKQFLDDMIVAQKKGEIRKDLNPHFILYLIGKMQDMTADEKVLDMYETSQDLVSELVNFFFYGILTGEKS